MRRPILRSRASIHGTQGIAPALKHLTPFAIAIVAPSCPAVRQALRLGNFLTETKPLKFLHKSDGEQAAGADTDAEPLVLKLGNYLNGASGPKSGDASPSVPKSDDAVPKSGDAGASVPKTSDAGASVSKPADAGPASAPAAQQPSSDDAPVSLSVVAPAAEPAQVGGDVPAATSEPAPAAPVAEEPPTAVVVSSTG